GRACAPEPSASQVRPGRARAARILQSAPRHRPTTLAAALDVRARLSLEARLLVRSPVASGGPGHRVQAPVHQAAVRDWYAYIAAADFARQPLGNAGRRPRAAPTPFWRRLHSARQL